MSLASSLYETFVFDKQIRTRCGVRLQNLSLSFGQGLRLLHQRIRNADLADVVQTRGKINRFARIIRLAERLR